MAPSPLSGLGGQGTGGLDWFWASIAISLVTLGGVSAGYIPGALIRHEKFRWAEMDDIAFMPGLLGF